VVNSEAASAAVRQNQLVGTALVFAFLSNTKTLPVAELAKRTAAASAHLAGVRLPGIDRGFDELLPLFLVMLSPGNLSSRGDWLEKSRLWRLILLQRADGGFDCNESLAFALQAHEGAAPPREKPASKLRQLIAAFLEDDDFDDVIEVLILEKSSDELPQLRLGLGPWRHRALVRLQRERQALCRLEAAVRLLKQYKAPQAALLQPVAAAGQVARAEHDFEQIQQLVKAAVDARQAHACQVRGGGGGAPRQLSHPQHLGI